MLQCWMPTVLHVRTETAIERLARFVVEAPRDVHSNAALLRARLALIDTVGCAVHGSTTADATNLRRAARGWGVGEAVLWGVPGGRFSPPWAALMNGFAAHAMDLDDYTLVANDHPSAVLWPAVFAAVTAGGRTLGALLDAYLVGLEVIFRVGAAVNMGHYNLGWHTTSTIDGLGAAAAVARLDGLSAEQTASALSLTVSQGAGMVSQFGTSAKPLHAGLSAKAGLISARMAGAGLTGATSVLDGPVSLSSLMMSKGVADFECALGTLGEEWGIETHGLGAKVYPSCGYTHRAIDAAIALHGRMGPSDGVQITSVQVSLPDFHLAILPYHLPADPTEALFSTAWCVASGLIHGRNTLQDFQEAALQDRKVRALVPHIIVTGRKPKRPEINVDPDDPDSVVVQLSDGRTLKETCGRWTGMPGADLSQAQFLNKFDQCIAAAGSDPMGPWRQVAESVLGDAEGVCIDLAPRRTIKPRDRYEKLGTITENNKGESHEKQQH